jgi:hypothetical protein
LGLLALVAISAVADAPPGMVEGTLFYSRGDAATGATGVGRCLWTRGANPRVSPDGRWLLFRRDTSGEVTQADLWVHDLVTGVETNSFQQGNVVLGYDWSRDGSGYFHDYSCGIYRRNRDGASPVTLFSLHCGDSAPAVSPAGDRIAFHNINTGGLWLADVGGENRTAIPNTVARNSMVNSDVWPAWSPDGAWLSFGNAGGLFKIAADGSGRTNLVARSTYPVSAAPVDGSAVLSTWTPDGQWLVAPLTVDGVSGLFAVAANGSGEIRQLSLRSTGASVTWIGNVSTNLQVDVSTRAETAIQITTPPFAPRGRAFDTVIEVRNFGPLAASGLVVTSTFPEGLNPFSVASSGGSASLSGRILNAQLGNLAAGASARITLSTLPVTNGLFTWIAGSTQSRPDDPSNGSASAQVLALPGFTGVLSQPGERLEYSFSVPGTQIQRYVFDSLTDESDLLWTLDGPACEGFANRSFSSSDGDRFGNTTSILSLIPGNYRISVWHRTGSLTRFAFNLLRLEDAVLLTPGAQASVDLTPGNSSRLFQFPGTPGNQVRVHLTATNAPNLHYRLVNPYGDILDSGHRTGNPVTLRSGGNHFLLVEGAIWRGEATGSFGISTEILGAVPLITATETLLLDQQYRRTNAAPFTNSWRFSLASDSLLHFTSHTLNYQVRWQLVGPNGISGSARFGDDNWTFLEAPAGD